MIRVTELKYKAFTCDFCPKKSFRKLYEIKARAFVSVLCDECLHHLGTLITAQQKSSPIKEKKVKTKEEINR